MAIFVHINVWETKTVVLITDNIDTVARQMFETDFRAEGTSTAWLPGKERPREQLPTDAWWKRWSYSSSSYSGFYSHESLDFDLKILLCQFGSELCFYK